MDDAGQKEPWNRNEGRAKGREGPASKKGLDPDTAKFYMSFGIWNEDLRAGEKHCSE